MNKKMYKISKWDVHLNDVKIVNVAKETDKTIWVSSELGEYEIRERKKTNYHIFVDTIEEVIKILIERAEDKRAGCLRSFVSNKKALEESKAAIKQLKAELKECDK